MRRAAAARWPLSAPAAIVDSCYDASVEGQSKGDSAPAQNAAVVRESPGQAIGVEVLEEGLRELA